MRYTSEISDNIPLDKLSHTAKRQFDKVENDLVWVREKGKGKREKVKGMEKRKVETFEDLRVWQQGIELVKQVYLITREGEISRDFGLRDQLRRAAVSVPTNVAEGFERYSRKEYVNFLNIAKGSAGEVRSLLRVALEVGYLDKDTYFRLYELARGLSRMLASQIQAINHSLK